MVFRPKGLVVQSFRLFAFVTNIQKNKENNGLVDGLDWMEL